MCILLICGSCQFFLEKYQTVWWYACSCGDFLAPLLLWCNPSWLLDHLQARAHPSHAMSTMVPISLQETAWKCETQLVSVALTATRLVPWLESVQETKLRTRCLHLSISQIASELSATYRYCLCWWHIMLGSLQLWVLMVYLEHKVMSSWSKQSMAVTTGLLWKQYC